MQSSQGSNLCFIKTYTVSITAIDRLKGQSNHNVHPVPIFSGSKRMTCASCGKQLVRAKKLYDRQGSVHLVMDAVHKMLGICCTFFVPDLLGFCFFNSS